MNWEKRSVGLSCLAELRAILRASLAGLSEGIRPQVIRRFSSSALGAILRSFADALPVTLYESLLPLIGYRGFESLPHRIISLEQSNFPRYKHRMIQGHNIPEDMLKPIRTAPKRSTFVRLFGSFVATRRGTLNGVTPKQDRLARQLGIPNTAVRTKTADLILQTNQEGKTE